MPIRPGWYEDYWESLDKKTSEKIRTTCPRCGSSNTYFNKQFKVWRCGKCENSFIIEGFDEKKPWWNSLFGK